MISHILGIGGASRQRELIYALEHGMFVRMSCRIGHIGKASLLCGSAYVYSILKNKRSTCCRLHKHVDFQHYW